VRLLGGGFDQIIPANNRIFWPSDAGGTETAVERVSGSALSTTMPQTVISGPVRVETHVGSAVLDFIVALGAIDIHATTLDGIEVPGVGVTVVAADGSEAASGVTDVNGDFLASGLAPGSHVLSLAPPIGFKLLSAATQTFQVVAGGVVVVDAMLSPTVAAITISPADPQVAVGETLDISAQAFDVNGSPITVFDKSWDHPRERGRVRVVRRYRRRASHAGSRRRELQRRPQRHFLLLLRDRDVVYPGNDQKDRGW